MQRVLGLFLLFLVARKMQDLVLMVHHEVAGNGELAGGVAVVDPMARLAELFVCVVRRGAQCQRPSWNTAPHCGHTVGSGSLSLVL